MKGLAAVRCGGARQEHAAAPRSLARCVGAMEQGQGGGRLVAAGPAAAAAAASPSIGVELQAADGGDGGREAAAMGELSVVW